MIAHRLKKVVASALEPVLALLGPGRRCWVGPTRANIGFVGVDMASMEAFVTHVRQSFARLDRIQWVQVDAASQRVSVGYALHAYSSRELIAAVELAEAQTRVASSTRAREEFGREDAAELMLELVAESWGFCVGSILKVTPIRPSTVGGATASILNVMRGSNRLRRGLDNRLGAKRAELLAHAVSAFGIAVAQRPINSLVELLHTGALLRELHSRRQAWQARAIALSAEDQHGVAGLPHVEPRPVPFPDGPIEEYADRGWIVSLGGFAVTFLTTRSLQRSAAALFAGLPKPARLGRDAFAALVGHHLSRRGVLVQSPSVLRRLDRIDCLVLQGDLVIRDKFEFRSFVSPTITETEAREYTERLFDPDHPLEVRQGGAWALGPVRLLVANVDPEIERAVREVGHRGELVLGLRREGTIRAVIGVELVPRTGVDELVAAARVAGMRVVIASNDEGIRQSIPVDDAIPAGAELGAGIRRLQREGHAVALVASGSCLALAVADCSIGVTRRGDPVPWGAHLVCGEDLSDARFVVGASLVARQLSQQSVNVALAAAVVGAVATAARRVSMPMRRVVAIVNVASLVTMLNGLRQASVFARRRVPPPRDRTPWHALDAHGVLRKLSASEHGLSRSEALARRATDGLRRNPLLEFVDTVSDELFNPLTPMLAAGASLSAVAGSVTDAAMVGGVVCLNAVIGGAQRFRTDRAIRKLLHTARRRAVVRRQGVPVEVDATELVPGDVVLLGPGEVVPADCRLLFAESLEVDTSNLTGESLPVHRRVEASYEVAVADRSSMLYEGTSIAAGRATAIVVAVGDQTEVSRGVSEARRAQVQSGVEMRMRALLDMTAPLALGAGLGLVGTGLLRGQKLEELIGTGLSLAVASVPEGLPLLATAAQLAAARRLSTRGALVRNARSIEALGRVDVLCVDKTGTITEGRLVLHSLSDGRQEVRLDAARESHTMLLASAVRACPEIHGSSPTTDPTDAALLNAALSLRVRSDHGHEHWARLAELPFEPGRGYHASLGSCSEGVLLSVKGAPELIIAECTHHRVAGDRTPMDDTERARLTREASELASRGLRVLAVAERLLGEGEQPNLAYLRGLTFRGLLGFADPMRPTAPAAVDKLRRAGVATLMITGDHPNTARTIADELGILGERLVLSGTQLSELTDPELDTIIRDVAVFARVTPSQKVRVVRALQRAGRVVAMVGDGANDAPAIRLAHVGIAIGRDSTSAARSAADVVVTDERIETIVDAILEGRAMWASVRDAVAILVGGNLGEIAFTVGAGLIDGRPPLSARQLLLVNLLTDVAPAMAIALRPPAKGSFATLANEGPDASLAQPLDREIAARAMSTAIGAGGAWGVARLLGSRERASTVGLLALVGTQLGQTLRSGGLTLPVVLTSAASASVLSVIVQTPGISHFFGCRPLGPIGWATAITASTLATRMGSTIPEAAARVADQLGLFRHPVSDAAQSLHPGPEHSRDLAVATNASR